MNFLQILTVHRGQPLFWLRLPLLGLTAGLAAVAIAVCVQAIRGSNHLEKTLTAEAASMGIAGFRYDFSDIRTVTDVMLVVALLIELLSFTSLLALGWAWVSHPRYASTSPAPSRFLGVQAALFAFLSVWLFTVLVPTTFFVRTRTAMVSSTSGSAASAMFDASLQVSYWNYGFLRCLAAAPWFTLIFSLPATVLTFAAWRMSRNAVPQNGADINVREKNVD